MADEIYRRKENSDSTEKEKLLSHTLQGKWVRSTAQECGQECEAQQGFSILTHLDILAHKFFIVGLSCAFQDILQQPWLLSSSTLTLFVKTNIL